MAREQYADNPEASLLDRRSYLKLAGAAIAGAASTGSATAQTQVGYGNGGFGTSPYGGGEPEPGVPVIDSFTLSPSEELGDDRMLSVRWSVSDTAGDLDVVEVVVNDGSYNLNFSVTDISGETASDWDLFQFPIGTKLTVSLRVEDTTGNVTSEKKTVQL